MTWSNRMRTHGWQSTRVRSDVGLTAGLACNHGYGNQARIDYADGMRKIMPLVLCSIILTSCAPAAFQTASPMPQPEDATPPSTSEILAIGETPAASETRMNVRVDDPNEYQFTQLLLFDDIRPIYHPEFVAASQAPLQDEELIIGVALGGQAKAYPITVLRFREMVNDELGGIPILVSW